MMKKFLLLAVVCVFAQVKTEELQFPEMTEKQKQELEAIKSIISKEALCKHYWLTFGPLHPYADTTFSNSQGMYRQVFTWGDKKVIFEGDEVAALNALNRMREVDCQKVDMRTGKLNKANVKACMALNEMLKNGSYPDNVIYNIVVDAVVTRTLAK